jgi:hypothetical protein
MFDIRILLVTLGATMTVTFLDGLGKRAKVFGAVGQCIYCGSKDQKLGEEHIIPLALGGNAILPEASCSNCSDITGRIVEGTVLDAMWGTYGAARLRFNLPTRRPKRRPKTWTYKVTKKDGTTHNIQIPASDIPIALIGITTEPAKPDILSGVEPSDRFTGTEWVKYNVDEMRKFAEDGDLVEIGKLNPFVLARMIAKIAHAMAWADYRNEFRPLLPDVILGKSPNIFHFVGGSASPTEDTQAVHNLQIRWLEGETDYLVAYVRLFCAFGTPDYMVVIGERNPQVVIPSN